MKKKWLCLVLALLMCMAVTVPSFAAADADADTQPDRAAISVSFGLDHVSGSTYKMWARVLNPAAEQVTVNLVLYDASYNVVDSIYAISSKVIFTISKNKTLSSGTYHLRVTVIGNTVSSTYEKNYSI